MVSNLNVGTLLNHLEKLAPPSLAEKWDNVGLQLGSLQESVTGVLVSLDVTEAVLWEAVENDANCLVTHHPLFFRSFQSLTDFQVPTRLARLATQMGINILSFHTNLDSTREGLNDALAKTLKLSSVKVLMPPQDPKYSKAGLGRVGRVPKTTLKSLIPKVARALNISHLRYVGDPRHVVQKVAVMTGSGGGFFSEAKKAGADVLITGDVKYHQALDALAEEIAMVDIGHYAGEIGMVSLVAKNIRAFLKKKSLKVKVWETGAQEDPFQFWGRHARPF